MRMRVKGNGVMALDMDVKTLNPGEVAERLRVWFERRMTQISQVDIRNIVRRPEGFSAEIFTFSAKWAEGGKEISRELVLRLDPGKKSLEFMPSTLDRQFKTLKCIEAASIKVPAPKAYWLEEDVSFLGGPFIIMEKLPGRPYIPWSPEGRKFLEEVASKSQATSQLVEILAELHRLDWQKYGLSFLGAPSNEYDDVEGYIKHCESFFRYIWQPEPIFTEAVFWLKENKPRMTRAAFVHGDYRAGNLLFEGTRITGLTDWELSHLGDPHFDIGTLCSKTHRMDSPLMSYLIDRQFLYEYYEQLTGWKINHKTVFWWEIVFTLIDGLFWAVSFRQFLDKKTTDLRRARGFLSYLHNKQLIAEYLGI